MVSDAAPRPAGDARVPDQTDRAQGVAAGEVAAVRLLAQDLLLDGVRTFLSVPGHPASSLADELLALGARVDDAHDEKTAAEIAYGCSIGGSPVAVLTKGNGALLAAEPLQNAGPHGTGAPLLLIVGDDVRASSSTVPTDARVLGEVLGLPVFDLPAGRLRGAAVADAVAASATLRRPVVLRFTESLVRTAVAPDPPGPAGGAPAVEPDPAAGLRLTKLSRYLDFAVVREPELRRVADAAPQLRLGASARTVDERVGLLAAGAAWERIVERLPWSTPLPALALTCIHPLPAAAVDFCRSLDRVVVVEEGRPVVEDALQLALVRAGVGCRVDGQRNGLLPALGAERPSDVLRAVHGDPVEPPVLEARPVPTDAATHPFAAVFDALAAVRSRTGVPVESCVGSCISAAYPPWSVVDAALNLGGSVAVAAGVAAATDEPAIALIGDYALVHSGRSALDQVHQRGLPVLTVVLDNGRSAKTGGQESAVSASLADQAPLDLDDLVRRGTPDRRVEHVRLPVTGTAELTTLVEELLADLPAVLVVHDGP